ERALRLLTLYLTLVSLVYRRTMLSLSVSYNMFWKELVRRYCGLDYLRFFKTFACQHYCLMENVISRRKSESSDGGGTSPWELTHGEHCYGKLIPFGAKVMLKTL
ncbi:MAG: hypothetical protein ACKPKO_39835, partial [Candidatus Fonsibacter sp.]